MTDYVVKRSVGSVFTSGESIYTLMKNIEELEKRNIGSLVACAHKNLDKMDEPKIEEHYEFMLHTIEMITLGKDEAHFSIKMTDFLPIDVLTRLSRS